jgi:hypothetical protein
MCSDPGQELIREHIRATGSPAWWSPPARRACTKNLPRRLPAGRAQPVPGLSHGLCARACLLGLPRMRAGHGKSQDPGRRRHFARVVQQADLTPATFPVCTSTLVVGGGIAGMQAALDISKAGFKAYLVERQPTIGGHMLQYDKTFPTLDCAACIGTPKMVSVGQSPDIELLTYAEVEEVNGFIGIRSTCAGRPVMSCRPASAAMPAPGSARSKNRTIGRGHPHAGRSTGPSPGRSHHLHHRQVDRAPCVQSCPARVRLCTMIREELPAGHAAHSGTHPPAAHDRHICPAP